MRPTPIDLDEMPICTLKAAEPIALHIEAIVILYSKIHMYLRLLIHDHSHIAYTPLNITVT